MLQENYPEVEAADAKSVDRAVELLSGRKIAEAFKILADVIKRAPGKYVRDFQSDGARYIKFWDLEEFTHFVTDSQSKMTQKVVWLASAYPRAFYFMGFGMVGANEPAMGIRVLRQGFELEPHPLFLLETGKALAQLMQYADAIATYQAAMDLQPPPRARHRALALRGQGFSLIELNDLETAEQRFTESLKLDPGNSVALNELRYIAGLRRGQARAPTQTVTTARLSICAVCGEKLGDQSKVSNVDGRLVFRCAECAKKMPTTGPSSPGLPSALAAVTLTQLPANQPAKPVKRWWQFRA